MKPYQLISAALAALTLCSGIPVSAVSTTDEPIGEYTPGDVNCDGLLTISDAIMLARVVAEDPNVVVTITGLAAGDLNGSGSADPDDVTAILKTLAGISTAAHQYAAVNLLEGLTASETVTANTAEGFRESQLDFAANLLRETLKSEQEPDKNVLVSPYSVALALAMTANGAKGDTLAEMETVLGGGLTIDKLNESYLAMVQKLPNSEKAQLSVADSIWFRDDEQMIQVPEAFLQTTKDYYNAGAYKAPFDQSTVDDINAWVNENTHEMIPKVIDELTADDVMVLVNALAFEAEWETPFENSYKQNFKAANGETQPCEMMFSDNVIYIKDENACGFIKSYADGGYSFAAILPNEGISADDYINDLDGKSIANLLDSKSRLYINVGLPKFSYDYGTSLVNPLKAMGMPTAFGNNGKPADFSGLNSAYYSVIGDVLHKTHIDVDQGGTKAAAVTAVVVKNESVPEYAEEIVFDRPFIYMILDNTQNLPVFIGTVNDLSEQ